MPMRIKSEDGLTMKFRGPRLRGAAGLIMRPTWFAVTIPRHSKKFFNPAARYSFFGSLFFMSSIFLAA